eukprot:CAMPEP_0113881626 /NCGR_PEP_ID=MMETSP0780_2-20120614/8484_1 /TAXON_ID=652834 /ORGANISM="Palpitomonas bilix" /LENGTH=76 /DNA_ID=CAMNT_0000868511 /DNA_START=108 /DNA_END=338 /DNA_ORIENTATION=- /assembly_acc=CAM_ASM_000599
MSEVQYKKIQKEIEALKVEFEATKQLMPVSAAAQELVDFVQRTDDPFNPNWDNQGEPNPWTTMPDKVANKKCCVVQ